MNTNESEENAEKMIDHEKHEMGLKKEKDDE
jgi:hypothetical protein